MTQPQVSVVIPTRARPKLVSRAVQSVLGQTLSSLEIIVVLDGEDPETRNVLREHPDPRLRIVLAQGRGQAAARNTGVMCAQSDWVAFLDDDDEMLPDRLAMQLHAAEASNVKYPLVLCRCIVRVGNKQAVLPEDLPAPGDHISDYIFVKKGLLGQSGGLGTSLVFTRTLLLKAVPFPDIRRHCDWSWGLQALALPGTEYVVIPNPLVIYNVDEAGPSISRTNIDWRYSFAWAQEHRELMTKRAYISFMMSSVSRLARQQSAFGAMPKLLWEALRTGRPRWLDFALFAAVWSAPSRSYIALVIRNRRQSLPIQGNEPL